MKRYQHPFTLRDLKEMISSLPDDTLVVVPAFGHSYRNVIPCFNKAIEEDGDHLSEFWQHDLKDTEAEI